MSRKMDRIVLEGIERGLLAPHAGEPQSDQRPWPVLVLTAGAAWFSAIPLTMFVWLALLKPFALGAGSAIVVGTIIVAGATAVLRKGALPLFVEQLCVPGLLAGAALLGTGMLEMMSPSMAAALLASVLLVVACLAPRNWLRCLLGIGIGCLVATAITAAPILESDHVARAWLAWHAVTATWLLAFMLQQRIRIDGHTARTAAALESLATGLGVAALAGLSISSGKTFLLGAGVGPANLGGGPERAALVFMQLASVVASLAAAGWIARQWPPLRTWWFAGIAAVVAALAWFLPSLGAALAILSASAASARPALAMLAGASAVWMVGGLYYQLAWPLAHKAMLLAGAGAALGAVARFALPDEVEVPLPPRRIGWAGGSAVLCGLLVLAVANAVIWDKESLITNGTPVFVELAPADPRSLMQGDFMALNFVTANLGTAPRADEARRAAVARTNPQGITQLLRWHSGALLAPGEFLLELVHKNGRWVLVTDAWFFAEGEAGRWAAARYGEFRVGADGRALLVGLRGAGLEKL